MAIKTKPSTNKLQIYPNGEGETVGIFWIEGTGRETFRGESPHEVEREFKKRLKAAGFPDWKFTTQTLST